MMASEDHSESYIDSEAEERCATCDKWLEPGYYDIEDHYRSLIRFLERTPDA
jgi:hypothetical protein